MGKESAAFRELMLQVFRTRMAFRRSVQRALRKVEAGITFEMLQVLRCLGEEQGITQQVLAERIAKGKAALSNLIANLEKKKYVYRLEDASDRRNKRVYLSEEGALFYGQLRSSLDDIYASAGITVGMEKMKTLLAEFVSLEAQGAMDVESECALSADSMLLTVDELFRLGVDNSLKLQADALDEAMAHERSRTARASRLPDLQIGLNGGVIGQPIVFQRGLSAATYPDTPDWSQNYAIDFTQPLYEGGRIRYTIRKADLEKRVAQLRTATDRADVKLSLLEQYMSLFSLYKQREVLMRNIEV